MPRGDTHAFFEKAILGKVTPMSDFMDMFYSTLHSHHREKMHSVEDVAALAMLLADDKHSFEDLLQAGLLHLIVDQAFTSTNNDVNTQNRLEKKALNNSKKMVKE